MVNLLLYESELFSSNFLSCYAVSNIITALIKMTLIVRGYYQY